MTDAVEPDPEVVAAAVQACPSVAALSGEIASYLPGRRVAGVRTSPGRAEVHVVAHYGPPMEAVAAQVREAVTRAVGVRQVDVAIDDLQIPSAEGTTAGAVPVEAAPAIGAVPAAPDPAALPAPPTPPPGS